MEKKGTGAGQLDLVIQIGQWYVMNFVFRRLNSTTGLYDAEDISGKTFSLTIWKNKGDRLKTLYLTNGNGLTVPIYSTNEIRADLTITNTTIEEGEYVWELRRRDLNRPWVSGKVNFVYDSPQ